jgi:type VI protein secretion system component Hcp
VVINGEGNRPFTPGPATLPGGPENAVQIQNFTFSASYSGKTASKGPITIHRDVDSITPLLLTVMVNSQLLPEVKIIALISSTPASGNPTGETTGFFYTLQKAKITSLDVIASQQVPGTATAGPGAVGSGTLTEKIQFSYEGLSANFFGPNTSQLAQWGVVEGSHDAKKTNGKSGSKFRR